MPSRPRRRPSSRGRNEPVELELHGLTHGGEAVGRLPDGKACFVAYAIPGERVRVRVTDERKRWARAELLKVLEPSKDRVVAPCPYFGPGQCGGCQLQHVAYDRQLAMKRRVVTEQLERIGRFQDPPVGETRGIAPFGYRSQARFAVEEAGQLGFRRAGSSEVIPIDRCLLLDEATQALRDRAGDGWVGVEEVTVRTAGDAGCLVVTPGADALPPLPEGRDPVAVVDARGAALPLRGSPVLEHVVAGEPLTVSPTSFFQASPAAATILVTLVLEAADLSDGERVLDLYAGVGLFARALAAAGGVVTAVESHPSAADDARSNLDGCTAEVITDTAEHAVSRMADDDERFDVVVLDPPRRGADPLVTEGLAALQPRTIVYVSCDPAALARDARAICDSGYALDEVVPVDQFAQTAHIEAVAAFARSS